jgi:hypothetical protein
MLKILALKFTATFLTSTLALAYVCASDCGGGGTPSCDYPIGQNITVCQENCSGAFRSLYPQADGSGGYKVVYRCGCSVSCT